MEKDTKVYGSIDSRYLHVKITSKNAENYEITTSNDLVDSYVIMKHYVSLLSTSSKNNVSYNIEFNKDADCYVCGMYMIEGEMCVTLETCGESVEDALKSNREVYKYLMETYRE